MSLIIQENKKVFEKPESGAYNAVLVDTVDLGVVSTKFGNKAKVRIVWVLGKIDGSGYAVDTEGNPFRVMSELNASVNEKSDLFKLIRGVLGAAPPAGPFDVEQLIGRNNQLFIVREKSQDGTKEYANVKGILPYPAGLAPLPVPQGFVRYKDRDKGQKASTVLPSGAAASAPVVASAAPTAAPVAAAAPVALDQSF